MNKFLKGNREDRWKARPVQLKPFRRELNNRGLTCSNVQICIGIFVLAIMLALNIFLHLRTTFSSGSSTPVNTETEKAAEIKNDDTVPVKIQAYELTDTGQTALTGGQTKENPIHLDPGKEYQVKMDWSNFLRKHPGSYEISTFGLGTFYDSAGAQIIELISGEAEYWLRIYFVASEKVDYEAELQGQPGGKNFSLAIRTSSIIQRDVSAE